MNDQENLFKSKNYKETPSTSQRELVSCPMCVCVCVCKGGGGGDLYFAQ